MDLSEVFEKDLFDQESPYLSLYTAKTKDTNLLSVRQQKWDALRSKIKDLEFLEAKLDFLEEKLLEPGNNKTLVVLATKEKTWSFEVPFIFEEMSIDALPNLVPFLALKQACHSYIEVKMDRTGADVLVKNGEEVEKELSIQGSHDVISKVEAGGWSQRRFEQRAEDSWELNAKEIAEHLDFLVRKHRPEFILASGDVRAVHFLENHANGSVKPLLNVLPTGHGRAHDRGEQIHHELVEKTLAEHSAHKAKEALEHLLEEVQRQNAVLGFKEVVEAFKKAQVDTLFLPNKRTQTELCFGPDATDVAFEAWEIEVLERKAMCGPAEAVLLRAALGTSAKVVIVDETSALTEAGALLRY